MGGRGTACHPMPRSQDTFSLKMVTFPAHVLGVGCGGDRHSPGAALAVGVQHCHEPHRDGNADADGGHDSRQL